MTNTPKHIQEAVEEFVSKAESGEFDIPLTIDRIENWLTKTLLEVDKRAREEEREKFKKQFSKGVKRAYENGASS